MAQPKKKNLAKHYEQALKGRKKFQRFYTIQRAEPIEERDDRTVDVIFSSDEDVEMWFGTEKLLHGKENVDLGYFNAKMSPLLIDHRRSSDYQVGVIEEAYTEDGKGFARVRFGKGVKADEYYQDVIEGIRSCLSVGYEVLQWEVNEEDKKNPHYTATLWTPREISIVTFPADDTVGVIRSERSDYIFELQPDNEEDEDVLTRDVIGNEEGQEGTPPEGTPEGRQGSPQPGNPPTPRSNDSGEGGTPENGSEPEGGTPPVNGDGEPESRSEPTQVGDGDGYGKDAHLIFEMARQLGVDMERAYRAVREQKPFSEFAMELTKELTNARVNPDGTIELDEEARYDGLEVEEKDVEKFSLARLIASYHPDYKDKVGGEEREICDAEAQKRSEAGIKVEGVAIPGSIVSHSARYHQQRALERIIHHRTTLTASVDATAGHLVDSELRPENLIEWLYGEFAVSRAATWIMNARGNIAIPKQNGRTVATWGAETDPASESNPTFELLELSPKELKVLTPFTKTFAIQSSVDAENMVRRDVMRGLGESLDTALLYGTGANGQISGVTQIAEIKKASNPAQKISYNKTNGVSYENCLNAVEKIAVKNAAGPGMEWITSWAFWKQTKATAMLTNGSIPIWYENMICDFMATATSQVKQDTVGSVAKADHAFIANWMYLLVAMWGGMDLVVDPFTLADKGQIRVVAFYRVDSNFAHDEAFVLLERTA